MGVFSYLIDPHRAAPPSLSTADPVRGVSLELFAQIANAVAARHDAHADGIALAGEHGISPDDWLVASRWWNARIADDPAVAARLRVLCGGLDVRVAS